jgi:ABC-2 type transport system ATP-binding protein
LLPIKPRETDMHRSPAVRAHGITKSFDDVIALVDLDVESGQVHGLVGPNGAGKLSPSA